MNTTIPNYHVLIIKFIGWSNTLPSRVKVISERFNESVTFTFDAEYGNDSCEQAECWLKQYPSYYPLMIF